MKFVKKPVAIEAVQWDGDKFNEPVPAWLQAVFGTSIYRTGDRLNVSTLEGVMTANPGDWVIRGLKGELYPCKPDVFEMTYAVDTVQVTNLSFGAACELMRSGSKIARAGWNGKGMWLVYIAGANWSLDTALDTSLDAAAGETLILQPFAAMKTATGGLIPWLASQADIFARDWMVVAHG